MCPGCQTLDTCTECSQIVQLSANMISSRDTKVTRSHNTTLKSAGTRLLGLWNRWRAPQKCLLSDILCAVFLYFAYEQNKPNVYILVEIKQAYRVWNKENRLTVVIFAGDCVWGLACSVPTSTRRAGVRVQLAREDVFAKSPAASTRSPGEFRLSKKTNTHW